TIGIKGRNGATGFLRIGKWVYRIKAICFYKIGRKSYTGSQFIGNLYIEISSTVHGAAFITLCHTQVLVHTKRSIIGNSVVTARYAKGMIMAYRGAVQKIDPVGVYCLQRFYFTVKLIVAYLFIEVTPQHFFITYRFGYLWAQQPAFIYFARHINTLF